jgi:Zn finger protein HypA/HybF involved in hydrogenase expression
VTEPTALHRSLDQELLALFRGVSLECLVCGEFVLHTAAAIACPECGSRLGAVAGEAEAGLQLGLQAG